MRSPSIEKNDTRVISNIEIGMYIEITMLNTIGIERIAKKDKVRGKDNGEAWVNSPIKIPATERVRFVLTAKPIAIKAFPISVLYKKL